MKNQTNNIIFFYSFFALGFALILEYGFGLLPCRLCTFQRIPLPNYYIDFSISTIFKTIK